MIKTIIFDIGNVLLLFSHEKMLLQFSELLDVPFASLKEKILNQQLLQEYELGNISTDDWINAITSLSNKKPSKELFLNAMGDIFRENFPLTSLIPLLKKKESAFSFFPTSAKLILTTSQAILKSQTPLTKLSCPTKSEAPSPKKKSIMLF